MIININLIVFNIDNQHLLNQLKLYDEQIFKLEKELKQIKEHFKNITKIIKNKLNKK